MRIDIAARFCIRAPRTFQNSPENPGFFADDGHANRSNRVISESIKRDNARFGAIVHPTARRRLAVFSERQPLFVVPAIASAPGAIDPALRRLRRFAVPRRAAALGARSGPLEVYLVGGLAPKIAPARPTPQARLSPNSADKRLLIV